MNNYSDEVISAIQDALDYDNPEYTFKRFESFEDLPHRFVANDICLTLVRQHDMNETVLSFLDENINDAFLKLWKSTALGHFVAKDWKRANRGEETFKNYVEMRATIKEINMVILLRQLDEDVLSDEEFDTYNDVSYDGDHYAVVKVCIDEIENYSMNSQFEDDLSQYIVEEEPVVKRGRKAAKDDEDEDDDLPTETPEYFQSEQLF